LTIREKEKKFRLVNERMGELRTALLKKHLKGETHAHSAERSRIQRGNEKKEKRKEVNRSEEGTTMFRNQGGKELHEILHPK